MQLETGGKLRIRKAAILIDGEIWERSYLSRF